MKKSLHVVLVVTVVLLFHWVHVFSDSPRTIENINKALVEMGVQAEVVKVEKIEDIGKRGIVFTPAVVIDGKKKVEGKVPTMAEVKGWL